MATERTPKPGTSLWLAPARELLVRIRASFGHHRPAPEAEPEVELDNVRLINDEISARLGRLDANGARLDAKATTLLGFVLAAATFLAAHTGPHWWKLAAFVALGVSGVFGLAAMRPRTHHDSPEPAPLWADMKARTEMATLALLIESKVKVFKLNKAVHERKAVHWRFSMGALTLAVAFTVTTLAIGSNSHGETGSTKLPKPAGSASTVPK